MCIPHTNVTLKPFPILFRHILHISSFHHSKLMSSRYTSIQLRKYTKQVNANLLNLLQKMPKEPKHIAEAQRQRKKIKEKSSKYSPGRVTLQVLGTGAPGAPKSLYVFSDQSRYLFNCGEGTQRLAHEHKMKLAKLEHIFITQPVWANLGGLPGAALTIQDVGVPQITLHGPPGLEEIFVATKRFVVIKDLEISVAECNEDTRFEDNVLKVKYVPINRTGGEEAQPSRDSSPILEDNIDYYAHESSGTRKAPKLVSKDSQMMLQNARGTAMAFICQLQPRPGALCLDKCVKFGVPSGPLLGKLKSGEDVILPNGNLVKASDVCDPDDPGPVFIIIDVPTPDYIENLISNSEFKRHQSGATIDQDLASTVVHFSPENVINDARYRTWIDSFSPSTQHLVLNEKNTCMGSQAVHRIQHKLNLVSNEFFPLLGDEGSEVMGEERLVGCMKAKKIRLESGINDLSVKSSPEPPESGLIYVNTLVNHFLRPKKGTDRSGELKLTPGEFVDETMALEGFPQVLNEVRQSIADKRRGISVREYPKLVFLGTGSSIPNKTRNTSGILLEIDEERVVIMDCGEGTYGQIVRFYGLDKARRILARIKAIYVSHLHADHHLGLIGLLQGRRRAINELSLTNTIPVFLLAPKQIMWWLNFYDKCFESIRNDFELVPNADLLFSAHTLDNVAMERLLDALKMDGIDTCLVRHCPNAFGVCFTHRAGFKITYSGDTMPSERLVELGMNSDLLIHEATMEDELEHEAVIKMHSTTSQAIDIGKQMNAKYTLLTHFSQRYARLPRFNENFSQNIGIAFDNMQIKLDELPLLPLLYPALTSMFAEHHDELEHKAAKRLLKQEREKEALRNGGGGTS